MKRFKENDELCFSIVWSLRIEEYDYKGIDFLSKKNPNVKDKILYFPKKT